LSPEETSPLELAPFCVRGEPIAYADPPFKIVTVKQEG